jgi:hypothetical protein
MNNKEFDRLKLIAKSVAKKIYIKYPIFNINNVLYYINDIIKHTSLRNLTIKYQKLYISLAPQILQQIRDNVELYNYCIHFTFLDPENQIVEKTVKNIYEHINPNNKNKFIYYDPIKRRELAIITNTLILCILIIRYYYMLDKKRRNNAYERQKYATLAYNAIGMHGRNTAKLRFRNNNQPAGAGANNYRSRENKITRILRRVGWNNTNETRKRVHNLLERGYFGNIGNNNNGNNVNTGGVYESKDDS